jgi:hypothetical protein
MKEFRVINIEWDHEVLVIVDVEATRTRKRSKQAFEIENCPCVRREYKQCIISILNYGKVPPKLIRDGVLKNTIMPGSIANSL